MNIDTTRPSVGRIYDYMLGGHHNFEADRIAAQQILKVLKLAMETVKPESPTA